MIEQSTLLFVSTRFLFPVDSGGKIRTTQVLRGLKGGRFRIVLVSPANAALVDEHKAAIDEVCDEFFWWPQPNRSRLSHYTRLRYIANTLPIPVRTDLQPGARELVAALLAKNPSVAVFDFAHAAVLAPQNLRCPSVMFTHNVEAEIFERHLQVCENPIMRLLWRNQYRKMRRYEEHALKQFDIVVAVAHRDAAVFSNDYGIDNPHVIPTGVDLDFFGFSPPVRNRDVAFCGSMDWLANQEAVAYFMDEGWPHVVAQIPDARMTVVGRSPPVALVAEAARRQLNWRFTGFVDDVRPHVHGAVSVLPLRVGGGTRLKVYEAMAMGSPLVSTAIGVEGLPVEAGKHYALADTGPEIGRAVAALLNDSGRRHAMAEGARRFVEERCSYRVAARSFEAACEQAISERSS